MLQYDYKIKSSIGGRKEQQDNAGSTVTKFGLLVVVCDGMGGTKGGATASKMAVNIVLNEILNVKHNSPTAALTDAVKKANSEIFIRSHNDENCRGMGTTLTAIILQEQKATLAHVGDSRIYQLRQPDLFSKSLSKIYRTNDHSKVFELVKRGILTEEQARVSDESNIILRALGIKKDVEVEIKDNLPYLKGDRFLLCTDGVCGAVNENELLEILNTKNDIQTTVDTLIATIDQQGLNSGGGHDNLTAAIIECNNNSLLKTKIDVKSKIIILTLTGALVLSFGFIIYSKLSNGQNQKDLADLKQQNESQKSQLDSLKKANKSLTDSLGEKKMQIDKIEKAIHPKPIAENKGTPPFVPNPNPQDIGAAQVIDGKNKVSQVEKAKDTGQNHPKHHN